MKNLHTISLLLIGILFSCSSSDDTMLPPAGDDPITATYKVTYQGTWTASSHPTDYPSNSHFSGVIGMAHNADTSLFKENTLATEGIKVMAETGGKSPLTTEILDVISSGSANLLISEGGLSSGTSKIEFEITVSSDHSYVSLVSMIAPSPDWFVAVESLNLYANNEWIDDITINPTHYDSGTDDGTTFASPNAPSNPRVNIFKITSAPLGNGTEVTPAVATFRFQKI
ncbi:spondin domain-containing protein [Flammeovirga aprica]|uniref:Elongation factor Ts n=1 Tax=Flammeovirga aprica JL-4 TaxID=694437 RepID=A0A7X9XAZ1_9BACT|nr:spondin domain-containing protein [Flammeovirga aprica]NME70109.1 elongation factor Ts [Flammeovirga aprica JL-4]